ncbi:MAG: T9SS type A sorting domain-containing protein [Flavobacteriales bacterium]|nr:T9SS type A sorting domain-containing protein [Flavobacteriales bacterium]MCB9198243.1 T9SS type A sorting domain-containing protein [Flavobacteriales bacterium]
MKKLLLSVLLVGVSLMGRSQVVLDIIAPSNIAISLDHAYVDSVETLTSTSPWNSIPDMTKTYNAVLDTVVMAVDSTSCNALTNDLTGKIAFVYRGGCEFGLKALNAQNAGAVAVIIVNPGGAPIGMAAGTSGGNVTIPVTMISGSDGAIIKQALDAGEDVVMYFGPQYGFYDHNLGIQKQKAMVAKAAAIPSILAQNATEFSVDLGCWVYNYGNNAEDGTVTANINYNSASVYSETSTNISVPVGDSVYVSFTTFSQSTYGQGEYTLTYTINMSSQDDTPENDVVTFYFNMNDEYFSLSPLDVNTGENYNLSPIKIPADAGNTFVSGTTCLAFMDPNASRIAVRGVSFSASTYDPQNVTTLAGEYLEIIAYSWDDVFTDVDDANFAFSNVNAITQVDYSYDTDDQNMIVSVDFENPIVLSDNQRYLFCMTTYNEDVNFGYDNSISYDLNYDTYRQPIAPINNSTTWYAGYAGVEPTLALRVLDANAAGVEEKEVSINAYPNPAQDVISIPLSNVSGEGELLVMDLTGKLVISKNLVAVNGGLLKLDVSNLPAGIYVFNLTMENGVTSKFNVAVTK